MKPGFRLKTGISDHQRAKLSWLAANTEPNQQPPLVRSFHLTTKQPKVPSISGTNYRYTDYYDKLPFNPTSSPIYYSSNFQTIPSTYYSGYLSPTFIQPTHLPGEIGVTMISGNDNGDIEKDQLVNVEQMKGKGIRKVEGVAKLIDSKFHEMNKTRNTATTVTTISTTTAAVDDGSNLLGSLLSGRLDNVDWFGSLFRPQLPTKEEGSAMAQIFQGGIFGPAS
ncbi:unnamed protein product [Acanthocheilonema viteae]|uniref:Uncharacterized protein n=1 Tax=Acanthocheilonema viteae TaxID=6277 RepID=A0A498SDM0_ACAVI|nr:unnamed protein product [Acanthocheilonema viteae]